MLKRRIVCRFLMILVLAAAFVTTSPDSARQKAAAPIPCTACEPMFNNCVANCGTLGNTWACLNQCANWYNTCISNCS